MLAQFFTREHVIRLEVTLVIFGVHDDQLPGHLQEEKETVTHPPHNWTTHLSGDSTFRLPAILFLSVDDYEDAWFAKDYDENMPHFE